MDKKSLKDIIKGSIRDVLNEHLDGYYLINEGAYDYSYIGSFYVIEKKNLSKQGVSEAKIGSFKKTKYDVIIYTNDGGNIPHMHILDASTRGGEFDCCVRIDKAEYFSHGNHQDVFNHDILKAFVEFISSIFEDNRGVKITYYQMAVEQWNYNNSKQKIVCQYDKSGHLILPAIPNYKILNNYET